MLVSSKELLLDAKKYKYGIGAFNAENMEMVQAIVKAAEDLMSPVIIQTTPSTLRYCDPAYYQACVAIEASKASVPVVMHLDHGNSANLAKDCLKCGYTSVMIDGSQLDFEKNIALTSSVCEVAHKDGFPVEAELGKVGGKEDDAESDTDNPYTDPDQAVEFIERTGCDSLAVGIGTAHGVYKGEPNVRIDVLKKINEVTDIPLVMHGTSGVPDSTVKEAIKNGICKINYATDLRIAFTRGVRDILEADDQLFDPKKYGLAGKDKVYEYVKEKIIVVGSVNKA